MMELCIYMSDLNNLCTIEKLKELCLKKIKYRCDDKQDPIIEYIEKVLNAFDVNRIYVGSEFCQALSMDKKLFAEACDFCREQKLYLTLVTPALNDNGIIKLKEILDLVDYYYELKLEVVCNDWGVVRWVNKNYSEVDIIAGRTLNKAIKEFRYIKEDYNELYTEEGLSYIKANSLLSEYSLHVLSQYNVSRCEIDAIPQGTELTKSTIKMSLYLPYTFISTGRQCLIKESINGSFFKIGDTCKEYCKDLYHVTNYSKKTKGGIIDVPLIRFGNTLFQYSSDFAKIVESESVNRIVIQM